MAGIQSANKVSHGSFPVLYFQIKFPALSANQPNYRQMTNRELVDACLQEGTKFEAWREFVRRFSPIIANAAKLKAFQFGHESPVFLPDMTAEILMKFCKDDFRLLRRVKFKEDDRFFGFVKVVATRAAIDYLLRLHAEVREGDVEAVPLDDADMPSADRGMDWSEKIARTADIEKALKKATWGIHSKRNQIIFWLRFRNGFSPEQIAALPTIKLRPKGVETVATRTFERVQKILCKKKK